MFKLSYGSRPSSETDQIVWDGFHTSLCWTKIITNKYPGAFDQILHLLQFSLFEVLESKSKTTITAVAVHWGQLGLSVKPEVCGADTVFEQLLRRTNEV